MNAQPTVFIVDDEQVIRDSVSTLLATEGIRCETYSSALAFLDEFDARTAGCLLLDVRMPEIEGLELLERLRERGLNIPVIILTAHGDVPMAVAATKAGAFDFIEKPYSADDLLRRVRAAIREDERRHRERVEREELRRRFDALSPREQEILKLIVAGEPTKRIAARLGTSFNTVRNQRSTILRKVQAESVVDLVRMASALPRDR